MKRILINSICIIILFSGCAIAQNNFTGVQSFSHDGIERTYYLHIPNDLRKNAPLVFVFHGYGGSAEGMIDFSKMNAVADQHGFAVCYPNAYLGPDDKQSWNVGYSNPGVDDVGFIVSLATFLQNKYDLNTKHTFATGMSNGGDMSYQLACKAPSTFAAIAPVAGCMMQWLYDECQDSKAIPVFETHGTDDDITLWAGDADYPAKGPNGYKGTLATIEFLKEKNKCTVAVIDTFPDLNIADSSIVVTHRYHGGVDNNEVWLYTLSNGKHDWPGSWGNMDIKMADEIWKFFSLYIK